MVGCTKTRLLHSTKKLNGKAIGVQMIEVLEDDLIPDHKRGKTLKYNKPNIYELNIR